jgi:hypothetical protein
MRDESRGMQTENLLALIVNAAKKIKNVYEPFDNY